MTSVRAIVSGTLVVGTLDGADALIFFGLRGARPIRIFQSIASGLLGRAAFAGGAATAILGVTLHFSIAFVIVSTFVMASRRIRVLTRAPVWSGILYGIGVYLVMNLVVVPASAAASPSFAWPVVLNGVLIHMFGVGLPRSLLARACRGRR